MTDFNHRIDSEQAAQATRSVAVRRVIPKDDRSRRTCLAPTLPDIGTVLMRLSTVAPVWPATGRWLVAAALLAHRAHRLIQHVESRGAIEARAALIRHASAVRDTTLKIWARNYAGWSAARERRAGRMRDALNIRNVARCREWAEW